MFLRFTKFSRPVIGLSIALFMLFAPALIAVTVESAPQKNKTKATPTPKKKAAPTPKKSQAKTKATPTPAKSKSSKKTEQTASKNKSASKKNEKTTASKNNQKTNDKSKNSKTADKRNQKQTLAANNKNSKSSKNERSAKTSDKNKNASSKNVKQTADKNRQSSKNTKPTIAKTNKTTPKPSENKSKTGKTTKSDNSEIVENKTETTDKEAPQIIVTTFSVPLKSQAKADAATLSNVKLGTVLKVTEKNPAWYKVQYSSGGKTATGWISANSTSDLNAAGKTEIYGQIVERNYKPQMDFETAREFYEFTNRVDGELDSSDKSAEIGLKRLLALRSALKTIPTERLETTPYKDFLKSQEKEIVYNEPAGQWLVASNQFWSLHDKYKKSTVSDTIAWEAANNPLPGECEGYVNCYLFDMRMRFGEYLNLHPNGKNASEALKNLTDYLAPIVADSSQKTVYQGPTDVTDRAEFNNLLAELRTIVARLPFAEKEKTLQQLRTIAEAYR